MAGSQGTPLGEPRPVDAEKENVTADASTTFQPAGPASAGGRKRASPADAASPPVAGSTGSSRQSKRRRRTSSAAPAAVLTDPDAATAGSPGQQPAAAATPTGGRQPEAEPGADRAEACLAASPGAGGGAADSPEQPGDGGGSGHGSSSLEPPPPPQQQQQQQRSPLPDWCDRSLVLREHLPEDEPADIVCCLPGHPLLALACEGQAELLLKVLQQGADPDAQDCRGCTALHLACRHAQLACVRALLEAGATQLPDSHGRTPVQVAEAAGHADVMALIQHHNEVQQQLQEQELQAAAGEAAAAAAAAGDEPGQGQQSGELGRQ